MTRPTLIDVGNEFMGIAVDGYQGVLTGKVALVTGAGRGIGREIALRLARDGAQLVVHYSGSRESAEATCSAIRALGSRAILVQADICHRAEVKALFAEIDREYGRLDIVVNNAGASGGGPLSKLDDAELDRLLGVNLRGPLYVASEAALRLGEGGRMINISSILAKFPLGGDGVYSATKAALESFTESWARELGGRSVTVNTVVPGPTSPGMAERTPEEYRAMYAKASPFNRIGAAQEIAAVVAFLASPGSSWVSGTHIIANGAASM